MFEGELLREEHLQSVHVQDMLGAAQTEAVREHSYKAQIVRNTIGMKQTARLQVTDVRFAKIMKDRGRTVKEKMRRLKMKKARREGVATHLQATHKELLYYATEMHAATVEDNASNEGVVMAARETAYLASVGDAESGKLRLADGPEWSGLPLGSSRLGAGTCMGVSLTWARAAK